MEKIKWCLHINKGIEIMEKNENLSRLYVEKSEIALNAAKLLRNNREWEISSLYYAMYFAAYSVLMRIGIKCENHSCTIEFLKQFLSSHFSREEINLLKESLGARVDAQYYADRSVKEELYSKMIENAPLFLSKCKEVLNSIKEDEIKRIRDKLTQLKQEN